MVTHEILFLIASYLETNEIFRLFRNQTIDTIAKFTRRYPLEIDENRLYHYPDVIIYTILEGDELVDADIPIFLKSGNLELIKLLQVKKQKFDQKCFENVVFSGNLESTKYFVEVLNFKPDSSIIQNLLYQRILYMGSIKYLLKIMDYDIDPNLINGLIILGDLELFKGLHQKFNLNNSDYFMTAIKSKNVELVKSMVQGGFQPAVIHMDFACDDGSLEIVKYLATFNLYPSEAFITEIWSAGNVYPFECLYALGRRFDMKDLHKAVEESHNSLVKFFIKMGIKPSRQIFELAISKARYSGNYSTYEIIEYLLSICEIKF